LLFPVIVVGVGGLYYRTPTRILEIVRAVMVALVLFGCGLLVTGLIAPRVHGPASHAFFIVVWLLAPAAAGVTVGEVVRSHRWLRLTHIVVPLLILATGALAAVTGYLPHGNEGPAENRLRFIVLHEIAAPALWAAFVILWLLITRRYGRASEGRQ
jgi:hypothetical protein